MILLDSSVLIEFFRNKAKDKTFFYKLSQSHDSFGISSITNYEIGIGNRKSHFKYWEKLTEHLKIIFFDKDCSMTAIKIYLDLIKSYKLIDLADILIGATAITNRLPLATLNMKHFERIKNLK